MAATQPRSFEQIKQHLSQSILSLQKPSDLIITLIYCIPMLAPVRVCTESGIFQQLCAATTPLSANALATTLVHSGSSSIERPMHKEGTRDFVVRMLRAVCALRLADEVAEFTYTANDVTRAMVDPGFMAGFQMVFDNVMGSRSERVAAAESAADGPWQRARNSIGMSTFDSWQANDPLQLTRLSALMERMQTERTHWTEWFKEEQLFDVGHSSDQDDFTFVDVGGGRGQDLMALARKYPNSCKKSRLVMVLEDLPSVLEEAERERALTGEMLDSRIEVVAQDFFEKQSQSGAGIYYLHRIMHDWPDDDCVRILTRVAEAMSKKSRIFINEVILPNRNCSLLNAAFDISMLALHSGQERDEAMWERLIERAPGLRIRAFHHPRNREDDGIIEVVAIDSSWGHPAEH